MNNNKSTGPVTAEGKARSALNATKHGFRSKTIFIPKQRKDEFIHFESSLRAEIKPQGQLEEIAFQSLLKAAWDMQRVEEKMADPDGDGADPFENLYSGACDHYLRYHKAFENTFHRMLRQLRTLQAVRLLQQAIPNPINNEPLPILVHPGKIVSITKRTPNYEACQPVETRIVLASPREMEVFDPDAPQAA